MGKVSFGKEDGRDEHRRKKGVNAEGRKCGRKENGRKMGKTGRKERSTSFLSKGGRGGLVIKEREGRGACIL